MTAEKTPVRAKCLGCHEVAVRDDFEETAAVELIRIRCATCGAKRVAKVVFGDQPAANSEQLTKPVPVPVGPSKEEEIDLIAEAKRIFTDDAIDYPEPSSERVATGDQETPAAVEDSAIETAYRAWLRTEDGGTISRHIRDRAKALVDRGFTHYGIAALFEAARFDRDLDVGPDVEGWKLNNNHRSRLARDLMAKYPELAGFFETRELHS